jgi:integrase
VVMMMAALQHHHISSNALLLGGYASSTQKKYLSAVNHFMSWCGSRGLRPRGDRQTDLHLANYMLDLWLNGASKVSASCALYGLDMLIPGIRHRLLLSKRSLRGFNRLVPSIPRPPMPFTVAAAIALWLVAKRKGAMAIGILLSFDCYLRVSELLQLDVSDVAFGDDVRIGLDGDEVFGRVHLHLRRTKTGPNKGVEVANGHVKVLLRVLCDKVGSGRLFNYHISTYRRWFKKACISLGLSSDYTPHSLRHGGATYDYLNGMPIGDVMVRGRWAQSKSASHYISMGRQLMMLQRVPPLVDGIGREALKTLSLSIILAHECALTQYTRVRTPLRTLVSVGTT